jgi:uncharacterized membrane protein YkvA (DUF1232 family)
MAESKKPMITPDNQDPGFWKGLTKQIKLITRLMGDSRVNPILKVLPLGALAYLVWPADLLPLIPIDDAFVIGVGFYTFVELCPDDVVAEHKAAIASERAAADQIKKEQE